MNKIILLILISVFVFCSCEEEYYEQVSKNGYEDLVPIIEVLNEDSDYSEFVDLLEKTGVDKLLVKGAVYTVFAPVNEAIEQYDSDYPERAVSMLDSIELKHFVEAHIAFGIYYEYDFNKQNRVYNKVRFQTRYYNKDFNQYKSVSVFPEFFFEGNRSFNLTADYEYIYKQQYLPEDSTFYVQSSKVLADKTDISCSNGVIHGVDAVIQPKKNLRELIRDDERFSLYNSFIERFDTLVPVYDESEVSHYQMQYWYVDENRVKQQIQGLSYNDEDIETTILIPTNDVLMAFFEPYMETYQGNLKNLPDEIVVEMLKYNHVRNSYKNKLFPQEMNLSKAMLSGFVMKPYEYIEDAPIVASNGFLYPVKKLLAPRMIASATGKILMDPQFQSFRYLMEESGMASRVANATYASNEFILDSRIWYPKSWTIIAPKEVVFSDSLTKSIYNMSVWELRDMMDYLTITDTIFLDGSVDAEFDEGTFVKNFDDGYYKTYFGTFMRKNGNTLYSSIYTDSTAQIIDRVVGSNGIIYIVDDILYNFRRNYTLFKQMNNYRNEISLFFDELGTGLYSDIKDEINDNSSDLSLFIPTNRAIEAYDEIAEGDPDLRMWDEMDVDDREAFMRNHIIRKRFMIQDNGEKELYSASGNKIRLFKDRGQLRITGESAKIPPAGYKTINAQASNGVLNIIDQVLLAE